MIETIESNVLRNVELFDEFDQKVEENESVISQELNSTNSNQKMKAFRSIEEIKDVIVLKREPQNRLILMGVIFAKGDPLH